MSSTPTDKYSASQQGLGYMYQPQFALLKLFELPETTELLIEKDDDLDFIEINGAKSLGSLKHKGIGDKLSDLSVDFWKSVRIWLSRYERDSCQESNLRFLLFTTSSVSPDSFLSVFTREHSKANTPISDTLSAAKAALAKSKTKLSQEISGQLNDMTVPQQEDFFSRVSIIDSTPRIAEIQAIIINEHMRSVRREFRQPVFDRLQGWWHQQTILLLTGDRSIPISGIELSDMLSVISDEYRQDNLPIHFAGAIPSAGVDASGDTRQFVAQLREIDLSTSRIQSAILDYYRAFSQRSTWVRESVLSPGELERHEARILEEWGRNRDIIFEDLDDSVTDKQLRQGGRRLYNWAEIDSGSFESLRIRALVTEPYVVRGCFHILANEQPAPRVYWHPSFQEKINLIAGEQK